MEARFVSNAVTSSQSWLLNWPSGRQGDIETSAAQSQSRSRKNACAEKSAGRWVHFITEKNRLFKSSHGQSADALTCVYVLSAAQAGAGQYDNESGCGRAAVCHHSTETPISL